LRRNAVFVLVLAVKLALNRFYTTSADFSLSIDPHASDQVIYPISQSQETPLRARAGASFLATGVKFT
jgi:hypothetical protein